MSASEKDVRQWSVIRGDALLALGELSSNSIDAVVSDPPYGISFGGEEWDTPIRAERAQSPGEAFEEWTKRWATECLRLLKPGGHLAAFGAPRTAHRLAAGLEDAGFELRDQLMWLYGTGVPKTRLHEGRASQLKPAYEPIVLARRPLEGTLGTNEERWGTGRLGIDATRLPADASRTLGRWPPNVVIAHDSSCTSKCSPTCAVRRLENSREGSSRFFYCPKPTRAERDAGCEQLRAKAIRIYGPSMPRPRRNTHPTVKPVALMRWLVRLTCPPHGTVLDPFAGSGTTGIAAVHEQRQFIGIEREARYARIARMRLHHAESALEGGPG